jgi:hydroxypyruvate reductase
VPGRSSPLEALETLERYGVELPHSIEAHLRSGAARGPSPADPRLSENEVETIATGLDAMRGAERAARRSGLAPFLLGAALEGEARALGEAHARLALAASAGEGPAAAPCVLLSGGETSVTVRGEGCGGRNTEYLLSLALALKGHPGIWALAADTDGLDGRSGAAGALCPPDALARGAEAGLDGAALLERNDSARLFESLGELVVTGPTRTNVSDFRAVYVSSPR